MRTEISSQTPYGSIYSSALAAISWKKVPDEVDINVICRYGSVYDRERQSCISGYQKLFHSYDRSGDTLSFVYDSSSIYPYYLALEFWVYVEKFNTYTSMFKHTNYVEFGFSQNQVLFDVLATTKTSCSFTDNALKTHEWFHLAVSYNKDDRSSKMYKNGLIQQICGTNYHSAMSSPVVGSTITLLGSGLNTLNGYVAEYRIWNYLRNDNEIKYNYRRRLATEVSVYLKWIFRFNEGSGKVIGEYKSANPLTITLANDVEWSNDILPVPICGNDCYFDGVECRCIFTYSNNSIGDLIMPYRPRSSNLDFPKVAYKNPCTFTFWSQMKATSTDINMLSVRNLATSIEYFRSYWSYSSNVFAVSGNNYWITISSTIQLNQWYHITIVIDYTGSSIATVFYALNGGNFYGSSSVTWTRIDDNTEITARLIRTYANYRDFRMYRYKLSQYEVTYGFRNMQRPMGEYFFWYDLLDAPGTYVLRDITGRVGGNYKFDSTQLHHNSISSLALDEVPFICGPGKVYNPTTGFCALQRRAQLFYDSNYRSSMTSLINNYMITFWLRYEVNTPPSTNLVAVDFDSVPRDWIIFLTSTQVCANVQTSGSAPSACSSLSGKGIWMFFAAYITSSSSSPPSTVNSVLIKYTTATTGVATTDTKVQTTNGGYFNYGATCSSCKVAVKEMKLYTTLPTISPPGTLASEMMYRDDNTFNSNLVLIYYHDFSNSIVGHYYQTTYSKFGTDYLPNDVNAITEDYYNPFKNDPACVAGQYHDGVKCVPTFGHMLISNPIATFQTIPIHGQLANLDTWTIEAWTISSDRVTGTETYYIIGLGDDDVSFMATYRNSAPITYVLKKKIGVNVDTADLSSTITAKENLWTYITLSMADISADNNFALYVEGKTSSTAKITTSNWANAYVDAKLNYIMVGGALGDTKTTIHPNLRVKNIRLWKGASQYQKMSYMNQRGYDYSWVIPDLLSSYDFSKGFDSALETNTYPQRIFTKIKTVDFYTSPNNYYEAPSTYENVIPNLELETANLAKIGECPPQFVMRGGKCLKDEGAINPYSPELKVVRTKLTLGNKEISADWTIEMWIKIRSMTGSDTPIMVQETLDMNGLAIKRNSNLNEINVYAGQATQAVKIQESCGFLMNSWMHLVIQNSKEADFFKVFIEPAGTQTDCPTNNFKLNAMKKIDSTKDLIFGDSAGGIDGKVKEFRLWNTVRNREFEISIYKYTTLTAENQNQYLLYYPMNEGESTVLHEKINNVLQGSLTLNTGASKREVWSRDYDLSICYPTHTYDSTSMSCRFTKRRIVLTTNTIQRAQFSLPVNPVDSFTMSLWIRPNSITGSYDIVTTTGGSFYLTTDSSSRLNCIVYYASSVCRQATLNSPTLSVGTWSYASCAFNSYARAVRVTNNGASYISTIPIVTQPFLLGPSNTITIGASPSFDIAVKNFRLYSYYLSLQQLEANKNTLPNYGDPSLIFFTMLDDSYTRNYDPSNKIWDLNTSPDFSKVYEDRDIYLTSNTGGTKSSQQIITDGILVFTSKSTTPITLSIGQKSFYLINRDGFHIRLQTRITPPLSGKLTFFENVGIMYAFIDNNSWNLKFQMYNVDSDQLETFITQATIPQNAWTWLSFQYNPNVPDKIIIGIDDNFETFTSNFVEGTLLTNVNTLTIKPFGAAETVIREFSVHTVGFSKNEALLNFHRRIDPGREIKYLLSYYRINEGIGTKIRDIATGYYSSMLWGQESSEARDVIITTSPLDGPKWSADKDDYKFCKPHQVYINNICLNNDKSLWFTSGSSKSITLPAVNFTNEYTVEFWLYAKYDPTPGNTYQLFIRKPSKLTKIEIITDIGSVVTVRCRPLEETSIMRSLDGKQYLESKNYPETNIREKWLFISCANSDVLSRLLFGSSSLINVQSSAFPVVDGTKFPMTDSLEISSNGNSGFTGTIRELRIWNVFLSSSTSSILMRTELRPMTYHKTLLGYWKFDESAGAKLYDISLYSQTAYIPASDASGSSPEWIEIQTTSQKEPKLGGPSEILQKREDNSYVGSVYADKSLRYSINGASTTFNFAINYKDTALTDITARVWIRITSITGGGYFEIGRDKAFKITITPAPSGTANRITFYAGYPTKQIAYKDVANNIYRIHYAASSSNHTAYIHLTNDNSNIVYSTRVDDLGITFGTTTDIGIYFKFSNCDVYLRSVEIQKKYIEYGSPAIFTEKILEPPITDKDIVLYLKLGEAYNGYLYDHSIYGKEASNSLASTPAFVYDELLSCDKPASVTASVDNSGTEITITFPKKIGISNPNNKTSEEICYMLFTSASTKELGVSPKCEIADNEVKITVGNNPTFFANTKITFRQDTLYQEDCIAPIAGRTRPVHKNAPTLASDVYISVAIPAFSVYPTLEFTGPSEHRVCQALVLNAKVITGTGNRPLSKFSVTCQNSADCDTINAFLANLPKNTVTNPITIPVNLLKSARHYSFKASITNIFGQTDEKEITVSTVSNANAQVSIGGVLDKLKRFEDVIIRATAISTTCGGTVVAQGCQDFTFEMTQEDPKTIILQDSLVIKEDCSTFKIPANSINWDTDYWFTMRATHNVSSEYSGFIKFLVRAPRIPPVVYIKGSEKFIGFSQPFTIEGDELNPYVPDANETLEFIWECTDIDSKTTCNYADGNQTNPISSKIVTFDANTFLRNTNLKFCFKAISTLNNVKISSTAVCQNVHIIENMTNYNPQIKTSMNRINPQERLLLSCNALNPPKDEKLVYTWEIVTNNIDINKFKKIDGASSIFNSQFLDIQPNALTINETYTIKCIVSSSNAADSESTTITLRFNEIPSNGLVSVIPAQGIELTTPFLLKASNWIDLDNDYPLQYSFYYKVGHFNNPSELDDSEFTVIREGIAQNEITILLPAGDIENFNRMTIKTIVYDQNGGSSQSFTEIIVNPIESDQKKIILKELLANSSSNNTQELANVVGMILQNINDTTPDTEKIDLYPPIINKFVSNFTVQDKGFGKNLHLKVLDVIDDAVKLTNLPTETVLDSLEVILNIMKYEKNVIKSVYPNSDYYENQQQNFGLPQEYIKKISHSTSNIFVNLTDPNKNPTPELSYELSSKMSGLISDIGVSIIKEKFSSNATYSIDTQTFSISGVRASQSQTKSLNINASPNSQVLLSSDGLRFKNMSNSSSSTYDILVYEIDKKIYPKNNQTLRSHIVRMFVYNATEQRPNKNEPIYPARIVDCTPIILKFGSIKLEAPKAMPACSFYFPTYRMYAAKDRGLRLKKYNQITKEVECVTTHLTDFAVLEIPLMTSNINFYIFGGFMGFGIFLHLLGLLLANTTNWSFKIKHNSSLDQSRSENRQLQNSESTDPNVIKGIVEIEEHKTHKPLERQTWFQLLWYCYFSSNYVGKIIVIHSKYYSKQAFALIFNLRYALLMATVSMLYRYDLIIANTVSDQLFYSAILIPIIAVICGVFKLMVKNTDLHVYKKAKTFVDENSGRVIDYEVDTFSFKLAISYSIIFGIFAGSCAAVIMNEMIMPFKVSYHIANLFMLAAVADTLIFHTFIGIIQFILFTIVYRFKKLTFLKVFTTAEIEEILHVEEENLIEVIQS